MVVECAVIENPVEVCVTALMSTAANRGLRGNMPFPTMFGSLPKSQWEENHEDDDDDRATEEHDWTMRCRCRCRSLIGSDEMRNSQTFRGTKCG